RKQLLAAWIKAARPHGVSVISQVGGAPLPDVIELPRNVEQLVAYLQTVSSAAPALPLVYYHFPMMSGVDLNMQDFFATAKDRIPNFMGMKADLNVAVQVADQLAPDQRVFIAN
ncbi:putative N-acetyl neuraminate lyase, partial [Operophtera brumata]